MLWRETEGDAPRAAPEPLPSPPPLSRYKQSPFCTERTESERLPLPTLEPCAHRPYSIARVLVIVRPWTRPRKHAYGSEQRRD